MPGLSNVNERVSGHSFAPVLGVQVLGEYVVLPVPVTSIGKPGNTHEYRDHWQEGNTSILSYTARIEYCTLPAFNAYVMISHY